MDLLSAQAKLNIKDAFKSVADTFYQTPVILRLRTGNTQKKFGEGSVPTYANVAFLGRVESSKASGERYINVDDAAYGKQFSPGDRVYAWKDTLDTMLAGREINPETDRLEIEGKTYEFRMFTTENRFSNIGPMLYAFDTTDKGIFNG